MNKIQKNKQVKGKKNKKALIIAGIAIIGVLIIFSIIILCLILNNRLGDETNDVVDFNQRVTNLDGTKFEPIYDVGSGEDLTIRFTDLECNSDCSNISNLKVGEQILRLDEDYEIKSGSVIIIIYKKSLQAIQDGQYNIIFNIEKNNQIFSVGIRITIVDASVSIADSQEEHNKEERDLGDVQQQDAPSNHSATNESPKPPETIVENRPEFNLNDGYKVNVNGTQWLLSTEEDFSDCFETKIGEDGLPVTTRMICQTVEFTVCYVKKNDAFIKTTYSAGNVKNITTEAQFNAAQQKATEDGYRMYDGMGFEPDLDEQYCSVCNLSCGRW